MHCSSLGLVVYFSIVVGQGFPAATNAKCPTGQSGNLGADPGWLMTNFLYVVYDEARPGSQNTTTARINFDIIGGFSNQHLHCEATGPEFVFDRTGAGYMWRNCTARDEARSAGYTGFYYFPGDDNWNVVRIREVSSCGTEPSKEYCLTHSLTPFSLFC